MAGIRFFVELADQADAKVKEIEEDALKDLKFYKEQMENNKQRRALADVKLKTGLEVAAVGFGYSVIVVGSFLVEGMAIDVLRIGEGWDEGAWGKTQNILRGLAILGPALKLSGAGARLALPELMGLAKAVDINRKAGICSWIAAARSLRLSGQRIFITVQDLAKARGLSGFTADTMGVKTLKFYEEIFTKLKVSFAPRTLPRFGKMLNGSGETSSIAELEKAVNAADGNVVMFGMWWYEGIEVAGHAVIARKAAGGIQYIERTGEIFKSIGELPSLRSAGLDASKVFIDVNTIVVQNSSIVPTAGTVAAITPNFLNVIAVQVVPTVITPMDNAQQ